MNNPRSLRIFVLIDALGWEYLKGREFLSELAPYRRPLRTVLGFSSGAIPAILTGVPPARNGHWNLFYYDPRGSPFAWLKYFERLPDRIMNHRVASKLLKEMGRYLLGLGPSFDCGVSPRLLRWFNWGEKLNIYRPGGIRGARSIFDRLAEQGIPHRVYTYHQWTDRAILAQARRDMETTAARFYFLYLSEMDGFLHSHCSAPEQLDRRIAWYDRELKSLFEHARRLDETATMTIFSDHGMTPVERHYDLMTSIEKLGLSMPEDYLAVYDSTMARFWFFSDRARTAVTGCLGASPCGRILPDDELERLGVFFGDRRYGETVFLLHPGWLLSRSDFNGPRWMPAGMHGYHPDDAYSDAIFLSSHAPQLEVATIADVYQCMHRAAGLA